MCLVDIVEVGDGCHDIHDDDESNHNVDDGETRGGDWVAQEVDSGPIQGEGPDPHPVEARPELLHQDGVLPYVAEDRNG